MRCGAKSRSRWPTRTPRAARSTWPTRWRSSGTPSIAFSRSRAAAGRTEARAQIRLSLQARQAALGTAVARLLVQNNEAEEAAARAVQDIYARCSARSTGSSAPRCSASSCTSLYLIRSNRRLFARLASLSDQRRELAQQLIATREATLQRDLARAARRVRPDADRDGLDARPRRAARCRTARRCERICARSREIAQTALDNVRGLSQSLHPSILEEAGLDSTIDWYLSTVERQTGLTVSYERTGTAGPSTAPSRIHVYRVLQEALNNVARHSGADRAWVRLRFGAGVLRARRRRPRRRLRRRMRRRGAASASSAMRERASWSAARSSSRRPPEGGTLVRLTRAASRRRAEVASDDRRSRSCSPTITRSCAADFAGMLEDDPAIEVVGEASDGDEAIALARELKPHVVVMDCAMPGTSGLAATRQILAARPDDRGPDAQHALGRDARAPGARRRRARLRPEERDRSRPRGGGQAGGGRRDGPRSGGRSAGAAEGRAEARR